MDRSEIKGYLEKFQVNDVQFDLNGVCNAKCWYCPVKYEPQQSHQNMPIDHVKIILDRIIEEKGGIVSNSFNHIFSSHYNEILLYPKLEEFLILLQERGLKTMILTNGVNITPKKADILKKYDNTISGINFNTPAIEKETWKRLAGFDSDRLYFRLLENIHYLHEIYPERIKNKTISVGMNGINATSHYGKGGFIEKLDSFNDIVTDTTTAEQEKLFKGMFPDLSIYTNYGLVDRDGLLEKHNIISLKKANDINNKKGKGVIGCRNGVSKSFKRGEISGRPFGWFHINCYGDLFLCCQDFHMNSKFGNLIRTSLSDIWFSDEHINMIKDSFEGACVDCVFAQWG